MSFDKIKAAIALLDHVDDASWESDGRPRASAVTVALADPGVTVTDEDIAGAAPTYRRMSAEEIALAGASRAGADDEDSQPESKDPRIKAAGTAAELPLNQVKAVTVEQARELKAALDAEYVVVDRQLSALTARKVVINKERDKLLPILEPQAGNSLSETIQAYQRRSHQEQEKRVGNIQRVNEALGGAAAGFSLAGAPSALDQSFQKATGHGIGRKVQPGGAVTKPVAPAKPAA